MAAIGDVAMTRSSTSDPSSPVVGVGGLVFRKDRVLMIRRGKPPGEGTWSIPGGHVILGETVFEATRREVYEETGVTIRPLAIVDVVDLIERNDATAQVSMHYTLIEVLGEWISGQPAAGDDAMDARWVAISGLAALDLWSETRRIIDAGFRVWNERGRP